MPVLWFVCSNCFADSVYFHSGKLCVSRAPTLLIPVRIDDTSTSKAACGLEGTLYLHSHSLCIQSSWKRVRIF